MICFAVCVVGCFAGLDSDRGGRVGQGCFVDDDCMTRFCDGGVCEEPCLPETCGGTCVNRRCEQCEFDTDCPDGRFCELGSCVRGCDPAACTGFCDRISCRACVTDAECGEHRCVEGECRAPCGPGDTCDTGVCHRGVCGEVCTSAPDCLAVAFSDPERVPSRRTYFGCSAALPAVVDVFCGGNLQNSLGNVPRGCDVCLTSRGGCDASETCENGDCTCDEASDCSGLACVDGYCAPCVTDDECGCDMYCSLGECLPACSTETDCGPGFDCVDRRCASCANDSECPGAERCYEDGCVLPCESDNCGDDMEGRSFLCEVFSLRSELPAVCR